MKIYSRKWIEFRFFPDWIQLILTIWVLHGLIFLPNQVIPETVPCDSFQYCSDDVPSALAHPTIGTVAQTWDLTRSTSVDEPLFSSRLKFYPSVQINLNESKRPLFPVLFLGIVASLSLFSLSSKLPIPPVNLLFLPAHGSHTVSILWRWCWVLGVRNPQSIACEVWSHCFQDKLYNSDSLLIIVFLLYVILLLITHL